MGSASSQTEKVGGVKRVLMLGLDATGKTSITYVWSNREVVTIMPTIGFDIEECPCGEFTLSIFSVGGKDKIRGMTRHYYAGAHALVYVVDSADRDRIEDACKELSALLNEDDLREMPLLVIANKQDLPDAMRTEEIEHVLDLQRLRGRDWHVVPASARTREGLAEARDWLLDRFRGVPHNSLVATLHVARSPQDAGVVISCSGMAGNHLASIDLQDSELSQLTVADLRCRLAQRMGQPPNLLRLVLPCGRLLQVEAGASGSGGRAGAEPLLQALGLQQSRQGCTMT